MGSAGSEIGLDALFRFWETPTPVVATCLTDLAMFRTVLNFIPTLTRCCCLAVVLFSLGCCSSPNWNLRGNPFPEDELSGTVRQLRPDDQQTQAFGFSNKARQIEKDVGVK